MLVRLTPNRSRLSISYFSLSIDCFALSAFIGTDVEGVGEYQSHQQPMKYDITSDKFEHVVPEDRRVSNYQP